MYSVQAANNLIDAVERAIEERLPNAESFEPFRSKRPRADEYYRIYVKEYIIYYVVYGNSEVKAMEVRRLLHRLQKQERHIYNLKN